MIRYTFHILARPVGALGVRETTVVSVCADSYEEARLKLYDTHEHITVITCGEAPAS